MLSPDWPGAEYAMDEAQQSRQLGRRARLASVGLSPSLQALATERWPLPAFRFPCGHVYRCYSVPDEFWPEGFIPLWECSGEVVGVRQTPGGREFLAWDLESDDPPELLARSEQGLFFWLFSYLIEYEEWGDEGATMARLRDAAVAAGFRHFDRLWAFTLSHGQRTHFRELVRGEALGISDE